MCLGLMPRGMMVVVLSAIRLCPCSRFVLSPHSCGTGGKGPMTEIRRPQSNSWRTFQKFPSFAAAARRRNPSFWSERGQQTFITLSCRSMCGAKMPLFFALAPAPTARNQSKRSTASFRAKLSGTPHSSFRLRQTLALGPHVRN